MEFPSAQALASAPVRVLARAAFRQQAPQYDPRSGEGARRRGGRYNPAQSFPVLYLCLTRACAVAELRQQGLVQGGIGVVGLLPRVLYRYDILLEQVLDLTDEATLAALGLAPADLVRRDRRLTQHIGELAHDLGRQAILAPSATGVDEVLAVFTEHIGLGSVEPTEIERWDVVEQL